MTPIKVKLGDVEFEDLGSACRYLDITIHKANSSAKHQSLSLKDYLLSQFEKRSNKILNKINVDKAWKMFTLGYSEDRTSSLLLNYKV